MTQHTPGPWTAQDCEVFADDDCEHHPVAECRPNRTCRDLEEGEANARLIAAAPDMLEALTALADAVSVIPGLRSTPEAIKAARAIAKATGEPV